MTSEKLTYPPEVTDPLLIRMLDELAPWEAVFVIEFAKTGNASGAYRKAKPHVTASTVQTLGWRLTYDHRISEAVRVARRSLCADILIEARDVVREWAMIAGADPAELVRTLHRCCRFCHGEGHAYQWKDEQEFAQACQDALDAVKGTDNQPVFPDASGGFGFNAKNMAVETCPRCKGEGVLDVYIEDVNKLSPKGRKLFAGVKQTKDGLQVLMRDQEGALRNLAQYLGMLSTDIKLKGKIETEGKVELSPEQLAALQAAVRGLDV